MTRPPAASGEPARRCLGGARRCVVSENQEPVVVDGNVVSARTGHDNTPFLKTFMKMLNAAVKKA